MPDAKLLVVFSVSPATPDRLQSIVPRIQATLSKMSADFEQAFRSLGGDHFGYILKTNKRAAQIVAALQRPGAHYTADLNTPDERPFLSNADSIFIVELASDFSVTPAFTRIGTWLQRH